MRRILDFILIAVGLLFAVPLSATAQTTDPSDEVESGFDRDCMDDYGRDLCDAGRWSEIVATFGLDPAESVRAQGWRGVRVFTINGYSRDMPMVSVLRRGEVDGQVEPWVESILEVRNTASPDGERGPDILRRRAWGGLEAQMERLQDLVTNAPVRASDSPPPSPVGPDGEVGTWICLHAWVTVTESLTDQGVERRIRNACWNNPLYEASSAMSGQALRGFPFCNHLDPADYRNESTQLEACLSLQGEDKVAAADVLSVIDGPPFAGRGRFDEHLSATVRLTMDGERPIYGVGPVSAALTALAEADVVQYYTRVTGEADRVVAVGAFERYDPDFYLDAEYTQIWMRIDGRWRMTEMTVGPFIPVPYDD